MKDKKTQLIITIIIVLLLFSPILLKTGFKEKVFTSEETYLNLIETNQIKNSNQTIKEKIIRYNSFHVLISFIPLNDVNLALILPLLLGIISVLLLLLLLIKLNLSDNETTLIILLFSLTPIFLYTFTTLNPNNLAFPLILLTAILYLNKSYTTIIPLILTILINPLLGIIFALFTSTNLLLKNKKTILTLTIIVITIMSIITHLLLNKNILIKIQKAFLDDVLIELGSLTGYSIPLIILGAIGLFTWWEKGKERTIMTITLIISFIISLFISDIRLLVALILAIFSGIGVNQLIKKEWELKEIKQITLLIIFYIIVFSAIVTINTQLTQVNQQEVEASKFLSSIKTNGAVILTTEDKGFMIQYLSGKKTFLDKNSYQLQNYQQKKEIMNQIFYSKKLSELHELLTENSIQYIFIHEDMKTGKIWTGREEGLQFFLKQPNLFIELFDNEKIQIYKYQPQIKIE